MRSKLTLVYDPPQGVGPQVVVHNYRISFSPVSPHEPASSTFRDIVPRKFDVAHNVVYTITLTALNCFGESQPTILHVQIGLFHASL